MSINGDLKLDLGWISTVSASQIQFENAGWSKHPLMAEIANVDVHIDLWQLLTKFRVVLPTVRISQPRIVLERNTAKGSLAQKTVGPIGGRIVIAGTGQSFRELMATAAGNSFFTMSGGQISELLVELAGLDVAHALGVVVSGDKPIPIRCAVLDLQGTNGQMAVQTLVFDTANSIISGEGSIDLRDEKVDIVVIPAPKRFSPLSLRSYIRVSGGFKNITVFPDPIKTGTDSLVKRIFNVLALLVSSPIQPRDVGQGTDADCAALIASVQKQDPRGVVSKDGQKPGKATTSGK